MILCFEWRIGGGLKKKNPLFLASLALDHNLNLNPRYMTPKTASTDDKIELTHRTR